MKTFKFNNPNAKATIGQKILLHRLTGKDTKNYRGTMSQISKEIVKAQGKAQSTSEQVIMVKIGNKTVKAQLLS
jgi:hypothetical protein